MRYLRDHWQMIALTLLVMALWATPVMVPLRILVVFLHELSHGLAALLTGGTIEEISLSAVEGGTALTRGGSRFEILSAGYLGSLLCGVALFWGALRSRADRVLMAVLGAVMIVIAALYMRDWFALGFSLGCGSLMLLVAGFLPAVVNDLLLRVIGPTSMIYVPMDIFSDTIARSALVSDAYMLADEFGGSTMFWGGLWLGLSLIIIVWCLRLGAGRPSNIPFSSIGLRGRR